MSCVILFCETRGWECLIVSNILFPLPLNVIYTWIFFDNSPNSVLQTTFSVKLNEHFIIILSGDRSIVRRSITPKVH
jgi:hypothetical protein